MMLLRLITKKMSSSVVAFGVGSTEKLREAAVSAGVGWRMEDIQHSQNSVQYCCELQLKHFPRACSGFIY